MARILHKSLHPSLKGRPANIMSDSMHFDIPVQQRVLPSLRARNAGRPNQRADLAVAEPINVYHWAAVALVTALMCAVLTYAAGTPGLSKAASITSLVFAVLGAMLIAGGLLGAARVRHSRRATSAEGAAS